MGYIPNITAVSLGLLTVLGVFSKILTVLTPGRKKMVLLKALESVSTRQFGVSPRGGGGGVLTLTRDTKL